VKNYSFIDEGTVEIGRVQIKIDAMGNFERCKDRNDVLYMAKGVDQIRALIEIVREQNAKGRSITNALEIGLFKGGSFAFLNEALSNPKLIGLDYAPRPISSALTDYEAGNPNTKIYFDVSQDDGPTVRHILDREFPDGIDLVIDDASHRYGPTRACFETVLPYLNTGGLYLIEDWGAMPDLARDLISVMIDDLSFIWRLSAGLGFIVIEKGEANLPKDGSFSLEPYLRRTPALHAAAGK
jgi:hypothetical protein